MLDLKFQSQRTLELAPIFENHLQWNISAKIACLPQFLFCFLIWGKRWLKYTMSTDYTTKQSRRKTPVGSLPRRVVRDVRGPMKKLRSQVSTDSSSGHASQPHMVVPTTATQTIGKEVEVERGMGQENHKWCEPPVCCWKTSIESPSSISNCKQEQNVTGLCLNKAIHFHLDSIFWHILHTVMYFVCLYVKSGVDWLFIKKKRKQSSNSICTFDCSN
jgi:hypothetical protein